MSTIRDIKRQVRRDLHNERKIPALYIPPANGSVKTVHVRDLTKFATLGVTNGAAMADVRPRLIVDLLELSTSQLVRSALFSVDAGEMYRLENTDQPDGEFISVLVKRLTSEEINRLYPGGQPIP